MQYKQYLDSNGELSESIMLIDDEGKIFYIPNDLDNTDRKKYQEWLDLGNEPEPVE